MFSVELQPNEVKLLQFVALVDAVVRRALLSVLPSPLTLFSYHIDQRDQ